MGEPGPGAKSCGHRRSNAYAQNVHPRNALVFKTDPSPSPRVPITLKCEWVRPPGFTYEEREWLNRNNMTSGRNHWLNLEVRNGRAELLVILNRMDI